eukprot:TRINITY_DN2821_c0_g1_i2.p1 TRINITY_DN2821_c0_g1~~TRINITY_DN2821_c0_g1_i2.p1  ORF type:complete len:336 (-),score=84.25 TRINITY_DN2821_c0_g1_i2:5-1012(-)
MEHTGTAELTSVEQYKELAEKNSFIIINFWAPWSGPSVQTKTVFAELSKDYPNIKFLTAEAEEHPEISQAFKVGSVPHFIFILDKKVVAEFEGANPPELIKLVKEHSERKSASVSNTGNSDEDKLNAKIRKLISYAPVMLFMKGTPAEPACGFSRKLVDLLNSNKIDYSAFDILADNAVREGLKKFSNWPTYPQLYAKGTLIGGLDIVREMVEDGSLRDSLPAEAKGEANDLNSKLESLINQKPVMLFLKGSAAAPQCGFSSKMVNLLNSAGIQFGSFDIFSDNQIREGLKKYSNWPTYPQLYVSGKLIGGLDVVTELHEEGELLSSIPEESKTK